MRIIYIGSVEFSRRALEQLVALGAEIVGVCTLSQSAFNSDHCDLSEMCGHHKIPCIDAKDINGELVLNWISARQPDVIFCFGWSKLLKPPLLSIPPMGVVGFHPAGLPANRGRHPLIWALALGLRKTATTFFFMDEGADSGDILSQCDVMIEINDDAARLYEKMTRTALKQIKEFMPRLVTGDFVRQKQDQTLANTWRKRGSADGKIDWRMSATTIHNLVRALAKPYVGAHFLHASNEIKVWKTVIVDSLPANIEPGRVVGYNGSAPIIKCGEQGICLMETDAIFQSQVGDYL